MSATFANSPSSGVNELSLSEPDMRLAEFLAGELECSVERVVHAALLVLGGHVHSLKLRSGGAVRFRLLAASQLAPGPCDHGVPELIESFRAFDSGAPTTCPPPITVVSGNPEPSDGNHRATAAKRLGRSVDAFVLEGPVSSFERALLRLPPEVRARHLRVTRQHELRRELRATRNPTRVAELRSELQRLERQRP